MVSTRSLTERKCHNAIWRHPGPHTSTVGSKRGSRCDSAHSLPFANILTSGQSRDSFAGGLYSNGNMRVRGTLLSQAGDSMTSFRPSAGSVDADLGPTSSPFIHWQVLLQPAQVQSRATQLPPAPGPASPLHLYCLGVESPTSQDS